MTFRKSIELCSSVKGINMSRTHITSRGIDIIATSCPDLEYADFSFCSRLRSCADFEGLLTLPRLRSLNLMGTWKLTEDGLKSIDIFIQRPVRLGVSVELCAKEFSYTPLQEDELIAKLLRLSWIDLHVNPTFATRFLNHPAIPMFASSLLSMEIGSRNLATTLAVVPPQIGCLTSLTSLSIVAHDIRSLPSEFANLSNLKSLTLTNNRDNNFCEIGNEITLLTSLTSLNLSCNKIQYIPPTINRLTNLTKLNVSTNDLIELPPELGELTALRRLNVSLNRLSTLPHTLGQLSCLERLDCSRNSLAFITPGAFQNMSQLEILDMQSNKLTRLPHTIAQPSLLELHLNDNMLESLPFQLGTQLRSLRKLILHHNHLSYLPNQLDGLNKLKFLSLHSNALEYLPQTIEYLTSLKTLELAHNRLKDLPPTMAFLQKLRRVELQGNCFPSLASLRGINAINSLKSLQFDAYLQDGHSERCMCKFCVYSRFDEAHFDDIVEGDSSFESELITLFFNCTENDFRAMYEALDNNNFQSIFFVSHKIKGALSNMGAVKLSSLCTVLERQARAQCISACRDVFSQLQLEYGHIKQVLTRRLQSHPIRV